MLVQSYSGLWHVIWHGRIAAVCESERHAERILTRLSGQASAERVTVR